MSPDTIFNILLVLGYVACLLCFSVYFWPQAQVDGRFRSATRDRYYSQLPLLQLIH